MKKITALLGVMVMAASLTGCNTARGLGKDIEKGGEKVQDVAKDTQKKM